MPFDSLADEAKDPPRIASPPRKVHFPDSGFQSPPLSPLDSPKSQRSFSSSSSVSSSWSPTPASPYDEDDFHSPAREEEEKGVCSSSRLRTDPPPFAPRLEDDVYEERRGVSDRLSPPRDEGSVSSSWMCVVDLDAAAGDGADGLLGCCGSVDNTADNTAATNSESFLSSLASTDIPTGFLPDKLQENFYTGLVPYVTRWFQGSTPHQDTDYIGDLVTEDKTPSRRRRRRRLPPRTPRSVPPPPPPLLLQEPSPLAPVALFHDFATEESVETIWVCFIRPVVVNAIDSCWVV